MKKKRSSVRKDSFFHYDDLHVEKIRGKYVEQPCGRAVTDDELARYFKKDTYGVKNANGTDSEYLKGRAKVGRILGATFLSASLILGGAYHATHEQLDTQCLFDKFKPVVEDVIPEASAPEAPSTTQPPRRPGVYKPPAQTQSPTEPTIDPGTYNPPAGTTTAPDSGVYIPESTTQPTIDPGVYIPPSGQYIPPSGTTQDSGAGIYNPPGGTTQNSGTDGYNPPSGTTQNSGAGVYNPPAGTTQNSGTDGYYSPAGTIQDSGAGIYIPPSGTTNSIGSDTYIAPEASTTTEEAGVWIAPSGTTTDSGLDGYVAPQDTTDGYVAPATEDPGVWIAPTGATSRVGGIRNLAFNNDKKLTTQNVTFSASALNSMGMEQQSNEYYTGQGMYKNRDDRRALASGKVVEVGGYLFDKNGRMV